MTNKQYNHKKTILWGTLQLLILTIFLFFFYHQETTTIEYMSRDGVNQQKAIHNYLNKLQFSFLPNYLYFLFPYFIIVSISLIFFKKNRWTFLASIGIFLSALLNADKLYYNFFASVLSTHSYKAIGHAWSVKTFIVKDLSLIDWLNTLKFFIFFLFGIYYKKNINNGLYENSFSFSIDKVFGIIFFLISIYCYQIAFYLPNKNVVVNKENNLIIKKDTLKNTEPNTLPDYTMSSRYYAATFGIMNYHVKNLIDSFLIKKNKEKFSQKELFNELNIIFKHNKHTNDVASPFFGISRGRNIFLIHFESLSPILINYSIGNEPITPTLNKFIPESLYWKNIIDQTRFGGSSDSEFSVLTGMLPDTIDMVAFNSKIIPNIPALPRYLTKKGYNTISLHGFDSSFWMRSTNHPLLGFERMHFEKDFVSTKKLGWGIPDKDFFLQSADILSGYKTPFFSFLITLSTHTPYIDIPPEYKNLFSKSLDAHNQTIHYLQLIRYADDALGIFIDNIKKNKALWFNSMFIIYGDHKPALDEKSCDELQKVSGKSLFEPRFQCVPIIIIIPGKEQFIQKHKQKYDNIVGSLYDLFPTILHLLEFESPLGMFGTNLFIPNEQRGVIPMIKYNNGYVLNGILYKSINAIPYKDNEGYVFTNNESEVSQNHERNINGFKESSQILKLNKFIFHENVDINKFYHQH